MFHLGIKNLKGRLLGFLPLPLRIVIFNFRCRKLAIYAKREGKMIRIEDGDQIWYTHQFRLETYKYGLKSRGMQLGRSYLLQNIDLENDDVVIDCGANMGDLQLYFKHKNIDCRYFAFEPNPTDYAACAKNLILRSTLFNEALWNASSKITFYSDTKRASSSLIEPRWFSHEIEVSAKRLDEIVDFQNFNLIKLLKLEGEGAEPEILEGSVGLFRKIKWISVDAGPERGKSEKRTHIQVTEFLIRNGFTLFEKNQFHRETYLFLNSSMVPAK